MNSLLNYIMFRKTVFIFLLLTTGLIAKAQTGGVKKDSIIHVKIDSAYVYWKSDTIKVTPIDTIKHPAKDTIIYSKHLVSAYGGFGLSTLTYSPQFGDYNGGLGMNFGADYYYFFNNKWGISAGLNYSSYSSEFTMTGQTAWDAVDSENETFSLRGDWNGWVEEHNITTLGIPIMGRYRHHFNPKWSIIGGLGFKTAFLLANSVKSTDGTVTLSGYYPRLNAHFEDIPYQGFMEHSYRVESEFESSINLSAVAELGLNYYFNPAWAIFAGIYVEYGLTNLASGSDKPLISYESKTDTPNYNTVPASNVVSAENTLALGGKIGVLYDFGGAKYVKKLNDEEAFRLAAIEALKNAELAREKYLRDSIDNANRLAEEARQRELAAAAALAALLRQKQIQDSLEQARLKHIQDSINALKTMGEGKMIVEVKTDKLAPWEREILALPVEFALGSSTMTPESQVNASKIGAMLATHPELKTSLTGHTCDLGAEDVNYRLGLRRANAIVKAFVTSGVLKENLTTSSKGELEPVLPNTSEANRKKNRRVVVVIEDK